MSGWGVAGCLATCCRGQGSARLSRLGSSILAVRPINHPLTRERRQRADPPPRAGPDSPPAPTASGRPWSAASRPRRDRAKTAPTPRAAGGGHQIKRRGTVQRPRVHLRAVIDKQLGNVDSARPVQRLILGIVRRLPNAGAAFDQQPDGGRSGKRGREMERRPAVGCAPVDARRVVQDELTNDIIAAQRRRHAQIELGAIPQ